MKKILVLVLMFVAIFSLSGCTRAERVTYNLDKEAEEFKLARRIVAINGITDNPLFEIVGYCSIETADSYVSGSLEIACMVGPDEFEKHFIGLSDNVTFIVEQLEAVDVPQYHYQIVFAPQAILPIPEIVYGPLGD